MKEENKKLKKKTAEVSLIHSWQAFAVHSFQSWAFSQLGSLCSLLSQGFFLSNCDCNYNFFAHNLFDNLSLVFTSLEPFIFIHQLIVTVIYSDRRVVPSWRLELHLVWGPICSANMLLRGIKMPLLMSAISTLR